MAVIVQNNGNYPELDGPSGWVLKAPIGCRKLNENCFLSNLQQEIDAAVKQLLALKADYKNLTGKDYKPGSLPPAAAKTEAPPSSSSGNAADLYTKVAAQGDKVRSLKSSKAPKVGIYLLIQEKKINITSSIIGISNVLHS